MKSILFLFLCSVPVLPASAQQQVDSFWIYHFKALRDMDSMDVIGKRADLFLNLSVKYRVRNDFSKSVDLLLQVRELNARSSALADSVEFYHRRMEKYIPKQR